MKKNFRNFKDTLKTVKYMVSFVWKRKYGKSFFVAKYISAIIGALISSLLIVLPGLLINALTSPFDLKNVIFCASLVIILPVLNQLLSILFEKIITDIEMNLSFTISHEYFSHISKMDYEKLEDPEVELLQERAEQTLNGLVNVVDKTSGLLSAVISLVAIVSIIFTLNPLIILLICLIIFVNSIMSKRESVKSFEIGKDLDRIYRFQSFYPYAMTHLDYAKEIRVFNLKDFLLGLFRDSVNDSNSVVKKIHSSRRKLSVFTIATSFVQQAAIYGYCIYNVVTQGLPIGTMTIYLSATSQFASALSGVFQSYLSFAADSLSVNELIEFFNIPLKQYETGNKVPKFNRQSIIEFKNVYFKYPGIDHYALENLSLRIRGDEKLCIVGANGSGKSTFIKLLTRLYFPEKGEILLNGINIMEYDYEQYMRLFSPVFQDYAVYSLTLGENIVLADLYDREKLDKVCCNSGIIDLVNKSAKGYDVNVDRGKEEDSIEMSGGEGQKMAISRACYHGGEIFLLDEPTAALDPMAEYEIYTQFNNMITDKCAVLITHRLSAVQLADKVAVFDSGNVVEYGTHKELYAKGGIYTEMFDKQAQFYRDEPKSKTQSVT